MTSSAHSVSVSPIALLMVLSYASSFSIRAPTRVCSTQLPSKSQPFVAAGRSCSSRRIFHVLNMVEGDTDDDGWGEDNAASQSSDRISKSELEMLQNDLAKKQGNQGPSNSMNPERDLFIPIFTAVSVIGFTGLYGYEMLRLYSRGELYLPWEN